MEQLKTHCNRLQVPLFDRGYDKDPTNVAKAAIAQAQRDGIDVVLVDTAGRMQVQEVQSFAPVPPLFNCLMLHASVLHARG